MSKDGDIRRALVLDPIDRVSEVVFGVLVAISFTGSLSVAHAGNAEMRTMVFAALGCNLAWGLADAVMYLVGETTDRHRKQRLLQRHRRPGESESVSVGAPALTERSCVI